MIELENNKSKKGHHAIHDNIGDINKTSKDSNTTQDKQYGDNDLVLPTPKARQESMSMYTNFFKKPYSTDNPSIEPFLNIDNNTNDDSSVHADSNNNNNNNNNNQHNKQTISSKDSNSLIPDLNVYRGYSIVNNLNNTNANGLGNNGSNHHHHHGGSSNLHNNTNNSADFTSIQRRPSEQLEPFIPSMKFKIPNFQSGASANTTNTGNTSRDSSRRSTSVKLDLPLQQQQQQQQQNTTTNNGTTNNSLSNTPNLQPQPSDLPDRLPSLRADSFSSILGAAAAIVQPPSKRNSIFIPISETHAHKKDLAGITNSTLKKDIMKPPSTTAPTYHNNKASFSSVINPILAAAAAAAAATPGNGNNGHTTNHHIDPSLNTHSNTHAPSEDFDFFMNNSGISGFSRKNSFRLPDDFDLQFRRRDSSVRGTLDLPPLPNPSHHGNNVTSMNNSNHSMNNTINGSHNNNINSTNVFSSAISSRSNSNQFFTQYSQYPSSTVPLPALPNTGTNSMSGNGVTSGLLNRYAHEHFLRNESAIDDDDEDDDDGQYDYNVHNHQTNGINNMLGRRASSAQPPMFRNKRRRTNSLTSNSSLSGMINNGNLNSNNMLMHRKNRRSSAKMGFPTNPAITPTPSPLPLPVIPLLNGSGGNGTVTDTNMQEIKMKGNVIGKTIEGNTKNTKNTTRKRKQTAAKTAKGSRDDTSNTDTNGRTIKGSSGSKKKKDVKIPSNKNAKKFKTNNKNQGINNRKKLISSSPELSNTKNKLKSNNSSNPHSQPKALISKPIIVENHIKLDKNDPNNRLRKNINLSTTNADGVGNNLLDNTVDDNDDDYKPVLGATRVDQLMLILQARKKGFNDTLETTSDGVIDIEKAPELIPPAIELVGGVEKPKNYHHNNNNNTNADGRSTKSPILSPLTANTPMSSSSGIDDKLASSTDTSKATQSNATTPTTNISETNTTLSVTKKPISGRTYGRRKQHECQYCHKTFTQSTHLEVHVRSHLGYKPYKCPHCEKRFTQGGNLRTHIRSHTGEKPFKCDKCDKKFSRKGNLQAHVLTHVNLKPFQCHLDGCTKSFTQLGNLKSHQNRFHSETLNKLTLKLAKNEFNMKDPKERQLFEYLSELYRNSNKGIKGRGKRRKTESGNESVDNENEEEEEEEADDDAVKSMNSNDINDNDTIITNNAGDIDEATKTLLSLK